MKVGEGRVVYVPCSEVEGAGSAETNSSSSVKVVDDSNRYVAMFSET